MYPQLPVYRNEGTIAWILNHLALANVWIWLRRPFSFCHGSTLRFPSKVFFTVYSLRRLSSWLVSYLNLPLDDLWALRIYQFPKNVQGQLSSPLVRCLKRYFNLKCMESFLNLHRRAIRPCPNFVSRRRRSVRVVGIFHFFTHLKII